MKPHTIIRKGLSMRRAANLRSRSRRTTPSGFLAEMGLIETFLVCFPEDTPVFREAFIRKYSASWKRIVPSNSAGNAIREELERAME
jgi:hypothetical protein